MTATLHSALGPISVREEAGAIAALDWSAADSDATVLEVAAAAQPLYFARRLTAFDLPLHFGTGFNEQVRRAMFAIPLGESRSYGDLARP